MTLDTRLWLKMSNKITFRLNLPNGILKKRCRSSHMVRILTQVKNRWQHQIAQIFPRFGKALNVHEISVSGHFRYVYTTSIIYLVFFQCSLKRNHMKPSIKETVLNNGRGFVGNCNFPRRISKL